MVMDFQQSLSIYFYIGVDESANNKSGYTRKIFNGQFGDVSHSPCPCSLCAGPLIGQYSQPCCTGPGPHQLHKGAQAALHFISEY